MKKAERQLALVLFIIALMANAVIGQEATGLPGDNFSLDGALELFQKSKNLEAFEKALNKNNNKVNNLDLNEDEEIDYIRVIDNFEKDVHAIVLQVPLSANESQDIAVIEIEKDGPESAILQIIGDEDIYGEPMIVEPFDESSSGGNGGPDGCVDIVRITVNVWLWPSVSFVYAPGYVRYVSPWHWALYPTWWRPWRPLVWTAWRPYRYYYPSRYRVVSTHRVVVAHRVYTPVRVKSTTVRTRTTRVLSTNGNRTVVKNYNNTKGIATTGNKTVVANKNTGKYAATDGNKKVVGNAKTGKVAATNGDKKMVANKSTGKAAMTDGNKKAAINKSSGKAAFSNGDKKVAANKKTGTVKATNGNKVRTTNSRNAKQKVGQKGKSANKGAKRGAKGPKRKKGKG